MRPRLNIQVVLLLLVLGLAFLGPIEAAKKKKAVTRTLSPSIIPGTSPSRTPSVSRPSKTPTMSKPTRSPTLSKPTKSPATSRPSQSPTPPTFRPSKAPTTSRPSKNPTLSRPTRSPSTPKPTRSPVVQPCEGWKAEFGCRMSQRGCRWVSKIVCRVPGTNPSKCPKYNYGCKPIETVFCAYTKGKNAAEKSIQCASDPLCLWDTKKRVCKVNPNPPTGSPTLLPTTGVPTTPRPTSPTTQAAVTMSPISKSPTTQVPITLKPTSKSPTTQSPTSKSPTSKTPTTRVPTKTPVEPPSGSSGTAACYNGCMFASDGECDDGLSGSQFGFCYPGSDCDDCGCRPELGPCPAS